MTEPTPACSALLDDITTLGSTHADITLVTTDDVYAVVTIDTDKRAALAELAHQHGMTIEPVNRYACYVSDPTNTAEGSLEVVTRNEATSDDTAIALARTLLSIESHLTAELTANGHTLTGSALAAVLEHTPNAAETVGHGLLQTSLHILLDGDYGTRLNATSPLEATLATLIRDTSPTVNPWIAHPDSAAGDIARTLAPLLSTARALTR